MEIRNPSGRQTITSPSIRNDCALMLGACLPSVGEKFRQNLFASKLSGRVRLETLCRHLNAERLALAQDLPAPTLRGLAPPRSYDVIVVRIDGHNRTRSGLPH